MTLLLRLSELLALALLSQTTATTYSSAWVVRKPSRSVTLAPAFSRTTLLFTTDKDDYENGSSRHHGPGHDYNRDPSDDTPVDFDAVNDLLSRRMNFRRRKMYDRADEVRSILRKRHGVIVDDGERIWSVSARRSGGRMGRVTREYEFRGVGIEDLGEDNLRAVSDMLSRRDDAKRAKDYGTADSIRDDLFQKFSIRVDDRKRNWYFDWLASPNRSRLGPKKMATRKSRPSSTKNDMDGSPWNDDSIKSIPWGDEDDDLDPETYDEIIDVVAPGSHVAELYEKAESSLDVDKDEENYILQRITTRIEAAADNDYDTVSAIQTELLLCYDVHLNDEQGLWSKGGDFGHASSKDVSVFKTTEQSPSANHGPRGGDDEESLRALTVPVLKEKLREQGLPVSGKKAELIERLLSSA